MRAEELPLDGWMERLKQAKNRSAVFRLLDEFRPLDWTDEQRSAISKLYVRLLDNLVDVEEVSADSHLSAAHDQQAGGPVWYEKM